MSSRSKGWAARLLTVLTTLLMTDDVAAKATCIPDPPTVLAISPIDVPPNPVRGQVLGDPNGYPFERPDAMRCTYDPFVVIDYWSYMVFTNDLPYAGFFQNYQGVSIPVFRSGVIGVGIGMIAQDRDAGRPFIGVGGMATLRDCENPGIPTWGVRGRVYFFATGNITGGMIPARNIGALRIYTANSEHPINIGNVLIGPPRKPTCLVSTPSLAMNLGSVSTRLFAGIGTVAGSANDTITLHCSGGTGASVDVWVTLTDQTNPNNRSDRLSLTASSTASGVALQVLHGAQLLSYGLDASTVGNPNQWLAGNTDNGVFQIALTARFIQTHALIKPGTANGVATFTLSYR